MPVIPSAEKIPRKVATGIPSVVGLSARDVTGYGEIATAFEGLQEANTEYEYTSAETDFLTLKAKKDREAIHDEDYKTLDERYVSEMTNSVGELALKIGNSEARNDFVQRSKLRIEQSRGKIQGIAFGKETDFERDAINTRLHGLRETVLTGTPEEVAEARATASNLLSSAGRYYSKVDQTRIIEDWKQDSALGRLEMMEPEEQLKSLNAKWAENLPSDTKKKLRDAAKIASVKGKAIGNVDSYVESGLTEAEASDKADKIKDDDLRLLTEKRIDYKYSEMRTENTLEQKELFDKYQRSMDDLGDDVSFSDIDPEDFAKMDVQTRDSLRAIEANKYNPRTTSDTQALIDMAQLKHDGEWQEMINYVTQKNLFTAKDRADFIQIAIDGSMPMEVDDNLTDIQVIKGKLAEADITDKKSKNLNRILNNVGEWRRKYIEKNNKLPDDKERIEFLDGQFMNVKTDYGFLWDSEQRLYELDAEGWSDAIREMADEDPDAAEKTTEYFKSRGITDPNRADVVRIFEYLKGKE